MEKKIKKVEKEEEIESLKITVRDINDKDISSRNLNKKTTGALITDISNIFPDFYFSKCYSENTIKKRAVPLIKDFSHSKKN